jgi:hypothetical protein
MGLDITWYRGLTKAVGSEGFDDEGEVKYGDGWFKVYKNPDFPRRADDLEDRKAYKAEESDGFRAGSYGGYSNWRERLAKVAEYPTVEVGSIAQADSMRYAKSHPHSASAWGVDVDRPFVELINFSDCEGVIGTAISKKLASDFADFQDRANATCDPYFIEKYGEWRKAFEMASDNGCVVLH